MPSSPDARAAGTFRLGGDLPVHRLGYGAMRLTGDGIWGPPADRDAARAILRRAVALGITFIDTADSYGPFVSEDLIAEALHPYPDDLVVATKGGLVRTGPDAWHEVGRAAYLRQCVEMSLRRLKLEAIPLYQLHRIDPAVPREEQFGALKEMQDEGKIRHVGLSEVGVEEIEAAREILPVVSCRTSTASATAGTKTCSPTASARASPLSRGSHSTPATSPTRAVPSPRPPGSSARRARRSRWRGCCAARRTSS